MEKKIYTHVYVCMYIAQKIYVTFLFYKYNRFKKVKRMYWMESIHIGERESNTTGALTDESLS